jgi:ribosomal protein L13
VAQADEVAVVVVIAEGKVIGRHASRVDHQTMKHKRLFLHNHEDMLYGRVGGNG